MNRLMAAMALFLVCTSAHATDEEMRCIAWTKEILSGLPDACSDLCPQAKQFDRYDYQAGLRAAFASGQGLGNFLAYLDHSSIMGAGAEAHACAILALMVHWGDQRFSASLGKQTTKAKEQALGLLDYTGVKDFQSRLPITYGLARHE